jgi:cell division protein FtsZ
MSVQEQSNEENKEENKRIIQNPNQVQEQQTNPQVNESAQEDAQQENSNVAMEPEELPIREREEIELERDTVAAQQPDTEIERDVAPAPEQLAPEVESNPEPATESHSESSNESYQAQSTYDPVIDPPTEESASAPIAEEPEPSEETVTENQTTPEPPPVETESEVLEETPDSKPEPPPEIPDKPQAPDISTPETPSVQPAASSQETKDISDDEEILKFIEETKQKIYIVGAGGSGGNTLDRLFELGTTGASLVAMNTDAKHLLRIRSNRKIILGKKLSRGRGAGSNPQVGEKSAQESAQEIKGAIGDGSLVFITCGLGGGTGTGSAPVIAEAAKAMGALTVAVVTLPFTSEGKIRMDNALHGMEKLRKHTDTLIVIKNDKLLNLVPDLPLNTAFKVCDEVLAGSVKGIAELVTKSGLVNVDFADLRTILSGAGYAAIGLGEASLDAKQEDRARVAVETALSSPLLDADISSSTRALINVIGGEDMTLKEAEFIVAETSKRINQNAHIIWGARVEENIKKSSMRVLVVLAGVKFPKYEYQPKDADMEELDLDLIG